VNICDIRIFVYAHQYFGLHKAGPVACYDAEDGEIAGCPAQNTDWKLFSI
jgi:hypothetical protein